MVFIKYDPGLSCSLCAYNYLSLLSVRYATDKPSSSLVPLSSWHSPYFWAKLISTWSDACHIEGIKKLYIIFFNLIQNLHADWWSKQKSFLNLWYMCITLVCNNIYNSVCFLHIHGFNSMVHIISMKLFSRKLLIVEISVLPNFICWNPNAQYDGIWRWGLQEVIQ